MQASNDSIFKSVIRRFVGSFASIFGAVIGLFIFIALIGLSVSSTQKAIPYILPMKVNLGENGAIIPLQKNSPLILQINIEGVIGGGKDSPNTSAEIQKIFNQPALYGIDMSRIKGILLNINSPGGSASESDEMYQDIMDFKKKHSIPVHTWVGSMCASGGYYIAAASDYISAQGISIIGSVGVRSGPRFNIYKLMQRYGVDQTTITAGKNKIAFPMFSPMPKGTSSYNDYIAVIDGIYNRFTDIVVAARASHGLTKDNLIEYGAQIYGSADALKLGYIDAANVRYSAAVENFAKELEIQDSGYQVISFYKAPSVSQLFKSKIEAATSLLSTEEVYEPPFSLKADFNL